VGYWKILEVCFLLHLLKSKACWYVVMEPVLEYYDCDVRFQCINKDFYQCIGIKSGIGCNGVWSNHILPIIIDIRRF